MVHIVEPKVFRREIRVKLFDRFALHYFHHIIVEAIFEYLAFAERSAQTARQVLAEKAV